MLVIICSKCSYCIFELELQLTLAISNADISKYPLISKTINLTHFFTFQLQIYLKLLVFQSKFKGPKIYFEISIVLGDLQL